MSAPGVAFRPLVLPTVVVSGLRRWALDRAARVEPVVIGTDDAPYMSRWTVASLGPFRLRVHRFHRSDDDRAKHDHPWWSVSVALEGEAVDRRQDDRARAIRPGTVFVRSPAYAHWIEVPEGREALTLFLTGPRVREWGFLCPSGWRRWQDYAAPTDRGGASGRVGVGCD